MRKIGMLHTDVRMPRAHAMHRDVRMPWAQDAQERQMRSIGSQGRGESVNARSLLLFASH
jgi:hypothetical protein